MLSNINIDQSKKKLGTPLGKIRSYNEVVEFLDSLKQFEYSEKALLRMKTLDQLLGNISTKVDTVLVAGTNGKSSSMHFAAKLLKQEGFRVGVTYSTHFLTYNERLIIDFQTISNKSFTDVVNEIISVVELNNIKATANEIMTMAALMYFVTEKVDVVLLEVSYGGKFDPATICTPKIAAISRVAEDQRGLLGQDLDAIAFEMLEIAKPGSWFISAEQSKIRLQKMKTFVEERGVKWAMPIRKLASLPYIYEQLYGRIASLGERIAQIYVEDVKGKFSPFLRGNLLATEKGQRGRPTLEAKRFSELNPIKTLKMFWAEQFELLKGRFELLDKEKPTILLDNAGNLDAYANLFLGIRLLHYQKPIDGFALIIGFNKVTNALEAIKLVRYLLKKVTGQIFFVPLPGGIPSHDPQDLSVMAKELNVKARACTSFVEALEQAKSVVDERNGLVAIAGSNELAAEYWKQRGIKKF
jgi:folylpolyglutamate synthase/dihydrofolate synthase